MVKSKMNDNDNEPVTEKLCKSRQETMRAEINGLKKTIVAVGATITTVLAVIQVILTLIK